MMENILLEFHKIILKNNGDKMQRVINFLENELILKENDLSKIKIYTISLNIDLKPWNKTNATIESVTTEFPANWYRAYDSTGQFLGLYEKIGKKFNPVKMFL